MTTIIHQPTLGTNRTRTGCQPWCENHVGTVCAGAHHVAPAKAGVIWSQRGGPTGPGVHVTIDGDLTSREAVKVAEAMIRLALQAGDL